jgi:hypothetical protein
MPLNEYSVQFFKPGFILAEMTAGLYGPELQTTTGYHDHL